MVYIYKCLQLASPIKEKFMETAQKTFVASRKQLHRLARIVAMLKQSDNITLDKILECFRATEYENGALLTCGAKTVYRDLKILRDEYNCPLEYNAKRLGYTLMDKRWDFPAPALLNDSELLAVVIGAKFSQDILPPSIAKRVTNAVDEIIRSNSSATIMAERMDSLRILSAASPSISDKQFQTIFDAWSQCRRLFITYADNYGYESEREIEPQALVYFDMQWYIVSYCHLKKAQRTFIISRIRKAHMLESTFTPSSKIIEGATLDGFLNFTKIHNIKIKLTATGAQFAQTHLLHSRQKMEMQDDGTYLLTVPAVAEQGLVPWILRQRGEAVPLSPMEVVQAVKEAALKLASLC